MEELDSPLSMQDKPYVSRHLVASSHLVQRRPTKKPKGVLSTKAYTTCEIQLSSCSSRSLSVHASIIVETSTDETVKLNKYNTSWSPSSRAPPRPCSMALVSPRTTWPSRRSMSPGLVRGQTPATCTSSTSPRPCVTALPRRHGSLLLLQHYWRQRCHLHGHSWHVLKPPVQGPHCRQHRDRHGSAVVRWQHFHPQL
ncbi:hypothetical protein JHK87_052572 [Glycine soja]|nr:hypothetical protein JHK87_052572 [Glycine soja]